MCGKEHEAVADGARQGKSQQEAEGKQKEFKVLICLNF